MTSIINRLYAASILMAIAIGARAIDPLKPVGVTDMTEITVTGSKPHTFAIPDMTTAFEIGIRFPSNCNVTISCPDSITIVAHLSDKVVNSEPLSSPFYRFDIYYRGKRRECHEYHINNKTNNFFALKLLDGRIIVGNRRLEKEIPVAGLRVADSITVSSSRQSAIVRSIIFMPPRLPEYVDDIRSADDIRQIDDPRQGVWRMIDEQVDTRYGLPGGNYTLGTVADGDTVKIIYLGGAEIYPDFWKPGMLKGVATKGVDGVSYDLQWTDAEFNTDLVRPFMKIDDGTMTLSFPYDSAILKFFKVK